jgi:hypothetical protein
VERVEGGRLCTGTRAATREKADSKTIKAYYKQVMHMRVQQEHREENASAANTRVRALPSGGEQNSIMVHSGICAPSQTSLFE